MAASSVLRRSRTRPKRSPWGGISPQRSDPPTNPRGRLASWSHRPTRATPAEPTSLSGLWPDSRLASKNTQEAVNAADRALWDYPGYLRLVAREAFAGGYQREDDREA